MQELLAPAGSPEALDAAIGEGADGVYLGLKTFNARMRSANFAYSQYEGALRTLHRQGTGTRNSRCKCSPRSDGTAFIRNIFIARTAVSFP